MAESSAHKKLIEFMVLRINKMAPKKNGIFMIDSEDTPLPISVNGGIFPDAYYCDGDVLILGEAKTINDVDRKHSIHQYEKYIETIESFEGLGIFVLCVHWDTFLMAQKIIRRMLPENRVGTYIILSSNGKEAVL